jgi:hypothetical protein
VVHTVRFWVLLRWYLVVSPDTFFCEPGLDITAADKLFVRVKLARHKLDNLRLTLLCQL